MSEVGFSAETQRVAGWISKLEQWPKMRLLFEPIMSSRLNVNQRIILLT